MRAAAILCAFLLCNILGPSLGDVNSSLKKAFSFITQLLSVDEKSAVFPFFSLLQRKLLQVPQAPAKGEENEDMPDSYPFSSFFHAFGLKAKHVPSLGINFLIFISDLIGNAFSPPEGIREDFGVSESLTESLLNQPKVSRLLSTMKETRMMEDVLQEVGSRLAYENSDCVVRLLCTASPIVKGMQDSLILFLDNQKPARERETGFRGETEHSSQDAKGERTKKQKVWNSLSPIERMFLFMPSHGELMNAIDSCRQRYHNCIYS